MSKRSIARRRRNQPVEVSSEDVTFVSPGDPSMTVVSTAAQQTAGPSTPIPPAVYIPELVTPENVFGGAAEMRGFIRGLRILSKHFVFSDDITRDMFASLWLLKDASCVLKGSPGSGKTTLIQCGTLLWVNHPDRIAESKDFTKNLEALSAYNEYTYDEYDKETRQFYPKKARMPMLAQAKHNQDKEPDEIFYYTDVATERRYYSASLAIAPPRLDMLGPIPAGKPFQGGSEAPLASGPETPMAPVPNPPHVYLHNPQYKVDGTPEWTEFEDTHKYEGFEQKADQLDIYRFEPKAYPIVDSVVKLQNEGNRMNNNVADVMLGLLAEKIVEYRGQTFPSPKDRQGQLNFFDYNPHLDLQGMEMDRALLDRIDMGIYLTGGDIKTRLRVLLKHAGMAARGEAKRPEAVIFDELKRSTTDANVYITARELRRLWFWVDQIPIEREALLWVSYMSHLPNYINKLYGEKYIDADGKPLPGVQDSDTELLKYMDVTTTTYQDAIGEGADDQSEPQYAIYAEMKRPFGFRAGLSMLRIARANNAIRVFDQYTTKWDEWKRKHDADPTTAGPEPPVPTWESLAVGNWKDDDDRASGIMKLGDILPFVLDHRVNIGVSKEFMRHYSSFYDFVKYNFVGTMIGSNLDRFAGYIKYIRYELSKDCIANKRNPQVPRERVLTFREKFSDVFELGPKGYAAKRAMYHDWFLELAAVPP